MSHQILIVAVLGLVATLALSACTAPTGQPYNPTAPVYACTATGTGQLCRQTNPPNPFGPYAKRPRY